MSLTTRLPWSGEGRPPTVDVTDDGERTVRTGSSVPEAASARARLSTEPLLPEDPFDERNQLRDGWQMRIRRRIASLEADDFLAQCYALAALIRVDDPVAIWALLLWNTGVSPDLALPLRDWMRQGMPLEAARPHSGRPT